MSKNKSLSSKGRISWNKGKKNCYSKETLKKMSESHKGQKAWNRGKTGIYSEETLKKMSESISGKNHPFYGKHRLEATKEKISKSQKGKIISEETLKKMSNSLKDRKCPTRRRDIINEDIIKLIKENISVIEIAKIFKCSKNTIYNRIREYNK